MIRRLLAFALSISALTACRPTSVPPDGGVDVLVLAPLDVELAAVRGALARSEAHPLAGRETFTGTTATGRRVAVIRSGWGKAHVAGGVAAGIAEFSPKKVVLAGIGGGIDGADVQSGDVVIGSESFQHDLGKAGPGGFERWAPESVTEQALPKRFAADAELARALEEAASGTAYEPWLVSDCDCKKKEPCDAAKKPLGRSKVMRGVIATGDVFVSDPRLVATLRSDGAIAIDMEAAAAAQEALTHGVPFATLRVIADVAGRPESESTYYCVKPLAAKRLESVLRTYFAGNL